MESKESVWKLLRKCGVCGKEMSDTEKSPQLMPCCHSACKECIDDELQAIQDMIHTNSNNNHNKGIDFDVYKQINTHFIIGVNSDSNTFSHLKGRHVFVFIYLTVESLSALISMFSQSFHSLLYYYYNYYNYLNIYYYTNCKLISI